MTEPDQVQKLRDALEHLLADVEAINCTPKCFGMPVEDPNHPFHESVKTARDVLAINDAIDRAFTQL